MPQPANWGVPAVGPASPTTMASRINGSFNGLLDSHKGATRPAYAIAGTFWINDSAGAIWVLNVFDGTDDIEFGRVNSTTNIATARGSDELRGADLASAATIIIDTAGGTYSNVTGTTTITAITLASGRSATFVFTGILTLTNGASLILPGATNIVTAAGDTAVFRGEPSGVVRCVGYLRASGNALVGAEASQGADIASAATTVLNSSSPANYVQVTGTTTITAITLAAGRERTVVFAGALILTNGASLILPTAANITTVAGDVAVFRGEAAGVVRCVDYQRASGAALASSGTLNVQTFDASGTWTKPIEYSANSRVLLRAWGAGGSGRRNAGGIATSHGGGGGGYVERRMALSALGATETVTLGAGGAARTGTDQDGAVGGNTTFGSLLTAYGGGGASSTDGGGGGGIFAAGALGTPNTISGGNMFHGGSGGGGANSSLHGGGAGGGGANNAAGGLSINGGAGGAAGGPTTGVAGTQPGGGGGGATGTSGAGALGRVQVIVYPV